MKPVVLLTVMLTLGMLLSSSIGQASSEPPTVGISSGLTSNEVVYADAEAGVVYPGENWDWAESPEESGWSSEKLTAAKAFGEQIGSAAVMIVDTGVVIAAWGDLTLNYHCHSMRKSLISALYGIYSAEGVIDLSKTLAERGINELTPLTKDEQQATVADLLKARSGVYLPAAGEDQSMIDARPERGSHPHDTFWYYNNWDFNALGTIFDQETGEPSIYEAFDRRIAKPIGMQDYRPEELAYGYVPYSMHPFYGFNMSTRDLARFGLLFLRNGRWGSKQVVPADWVRESTASHSERGPESGYGYMWWTGEGIGLFPNVTVSEHSYYASGYGGHNVFVLPQRNLVIVHRANTFPGGRLVENGKIGILLWMILDAAGETGIGEPPFIDQADGVRLGGENLRRTIPGSTLEAMDGSGTPTIVNGKDGTLTVLAGRVPVYDGSWWIVGDRYCVDIPGMETEGCYHVVRDGDTLGIFDLDGTISIRLRISENQS